jgi:hypothetical protein
MLEFFGYLAEVHHVTGASRAFHFELVSVEHMEP